ncbi:MAG TPA: TIGR03013 family XrtA/PEP-CTERM system glycosyltransferase, partial [Candidatus Polarisedimenticolaceae bacterium]|nr:TIGR03013 family XrtA/PEP-CTERM system glycosyltransferase [Candidatus Polarisedimenticolaceae bacterium]
MAAPVRTIRPRVLFCLALEAGLVFGVLAGLAQLNLRLTHSPAVADLRLTVLLTGGLFLGVLLLTQRAALGAASPLARELVVFSAISVVAGALVFASLAFVSAELTWLPALLAIQGAVAVPGAVSAWRWVSVRFDLLDLRREKLLLVGDGETAKDLCRWIASKHAREFSVIGFASENSSRVGSLLAMGSRVQTDYVSLPRFVPGRADRVIVALDEKRGRLPVRELMELRLLGVEIEDSTSFLERVSGKISVESMLPSWLIFSEGFRISPFRTFVKRASDVFHATLLLVLTTPVMLLTALLIKIDSRGPILYRQARMGRFGREFNVLKFRSMRQDAEKASGPTWAKSGDPRITRIGRFIRKTRIDELPQLINILRGEMSFVGPRPERRFFVRQLENKIPYYGLRMTVRPGLTGWAQVEYGYGASDDDALEKLKYDLYYIKN